MIWNSALSIEPSPARAIEIAARNAVAPLQGTPPDIAFFFIGGYNTSDYEKAGAAALDATGARHLLGCTAGGVLGGGHEVERRPSVSVTVASLPDVALKLFHMETDDCPDGDASPAQWHEKLGVPPASKPTFIVLPDPFTSDAQRLVDGLDYAYPASVKVGGLASAGSREGMNRLYCDRNAHRTGAVGVALSGNIEVDTAVAQGCKPVGVPGKITKAQGPFLMEVNGRPAIEFVREQVSSMSDDEKELARVALFLGIAMDPFRDTPPEHGDFLVRNIMGFDADRGFVAVGAQLATGRQVQLHVRDKQTSIDDLVAVLGRTSHRAGNSAGALLFSCLGRGRHLYGEADKDSKLFRSVVGEVPLGGFFCNGEIGPVGGGTYIHGFTSSFGLFRERARPKSR